MSDVAIAKAIDVGKNTVARLRRRYVEAGLEAALHRLPSRRVYQRKLDGAGEAQLIAVVCSAPPTGQGTWTMQLLADRLVVLQIVDAISDETVRRTLKKQPQTVAEAGMVPADGTQRRVCGPYGGRAGGLPTALRPSVTPGLPGRTQHPTAAPHPATCAARTWSPRPQGLRVPYE
ncbi:MAG: helix-turn-helix domain-containing protein, partial [Dehalococcoidia bacterium]|nr:helix-turn-helix domain-containing protein [Dehalococcoidia bacterium]